LLDINGPLIDAAENLPPDDDGNPVFSKADTLASMKKQVDRTSISRSLEVERLPLSR
jgi:hypothetical protein